MRHPAFLAAFIVLFSASFSGATDGSTLAGSVRTADGMALPQIVLTLGGPAGQQTVVSGPEGRFRVSGLTPGAYTVSLNAPGFVLASEGRVEVGPGDARLDLTVAPAPVREHVVVAATRSDAALSTLGVSATVLEADRIAEREPSTFLQILESVPGVSVARTGSPGLQASAFVRGGESRFARVLVDGVPVNEPGGFYNFGSELPLELERVEVVRGAASSLYGSDALAGVIALVTRRAGADDGASAHAEAEAGSFSWRRGLAGSSGRHGAVDWNLGVQRLETDNEVPNSAFHETAGAASIGARLGETTSLRLLGRGQTSSVGTPGSTAFGRPDRDASFDRDDVVLGARLHGQRGEIGHELRIGLARTRQLSRDPLDSGGYVPRSGDRVGAFPLSDFPDPEGFQNDLDRLSAGYQAETQLGRRHLLTAGLDVERESGSIGSRSDTLIAPRRTNAGAYVQDRVVAGTRVFVTVGGRVERNHSYGTRVVPRVAVAARLRDGDDATTLRASAGAGIKEPSFFETFGVSFYAKGNPDLKPERSRTFDVGLEQRLFGSRLRFEATLFHHDYRDQIAYQILDFTTFQGSYVNLGQTRARGIELGVEAAPLDGLRFSAHYTHLDGKVVVSNSDFDPIYAVGKPLLRRPANAATLSAHLTRGRVGGGASLVVVGSRADSDFAGLGLTENAGYARLDARLQVRLVRGLETFVAAENLLDRRYQEVLGYPALGRGVRAGLRFRSAARQ
jgi:vitamin B12 transporter